MRNISRNMTEKLARERGTTHIDLTLVEDSLTGARTTMEDVITGKVSIADLARDTGEKIEAEDGEAPHPPMTVTMVCTTCGEEMQGVPASGGVSRVWRTRGGFRAEVGFRKPSEPELPGTPVPFGIGVFVVLESSGALLRIRSRVPRWRGGSVRADGREGDPGLEHLSNGTRGGAG